MYSYSQLQAISLLIFVVI